VIPLTLDEVAELCPGRLDRAPWADEVTGVQIDSRRVEEGELFVEVGSGGDFARHAFARGAAAVLAPDDAFAALGALGREIRGRSGARVVAITGSTGKTSTKDILAAMCRPHAKTVAAEGGHNNEIGLPLTLTRIERDTELVVCEMGMRGLGQIAELCAIARPEIGVITSIGPVHLELLGTIENVARAKAEVVGALPARGTAIVPDDPLLEPYLGREDIVIQRFGERTVTSFERVEGGSRVGFDLGGETLQLEFPFTARHQARNAAAALLAVQAVGLPLPQGRVEVELSRWRGEESPLAGGGLLINDAYNANPTSMRAALEHLADHEGRKVAILGEMAELGPTSPEYHQEIGALVSDLGIDVVLGVGELAKAYGGEWVENAAKAAERAPKLVKPGDVVLVKGSRAVGLEVVGEALSGVPA
jgi:UDP-N-acetylmuramoyl-tripeptide--D-alanyl-D-alanine ligase